MMHLFKIYLLGVFLPVLGLGARELDVHIPGPGQKESYTHKNTASHNYTGQNQSLQDVPRIPAPNARYKRNTHKKRKYHQRKYPAVTLLNRQHLQRVLQIFTEKKLDLDGIDYQKLKPIPMDLMARHQALKKTLGPGLYKIERACSMVYLGMQKTRLSTYAKFKMHCLMDAEVVRPGTTGLSKTISLPDIRLHIMENRFLKILQDAPVGTKVVGQLRLERVQLQFRRLIWKWHPTRLAFANPFRQKLFEKAKHAHSYAGLSKAALQADILTHLLIQANQLVKQSNYLKKYSLSDEFHEVVSPGSVIEFNRRCPLKLVRQSRQRQIGLIGIEMSARCLPANFQTMEILMDAADLAPDMAQKKAGDILLGDLQIGRFVFEPDQYSIHWDTIIKVNPFELRR